MARNLRLTGLVLGAAVLSLLLLQVDAAASPATYGIDEVYDNVNGDWFAAPPTLQQGRSYDLTIIGSGQSGSILGEYAQEFVSLGAFINYGETGTDWSTFPDSPAVSEVALGMPVLGLNKTYTANGSFTVPTSAPAGDGEALVWLDGSFLNPPEKASEIFPSYQVGRRGRLDCIDEGALASETLRINVQEGSQVVPEPATLTLLSLGMSGLLFRNRKRQKRS